MNINQWEIWMVDFNPTKGEEISKLRPAIVVKDQH
jgi:mRNA-degrading endonuclease toxin of MazEF toxin-antitoxin module